MVRLGFEFGSEVLVFGVIYWGCDIYFLGWFLVCSLRVYRGLCKGFRILFCDF